MKLSLRAARVNAGYSLNEVAEVVCVGKSTVSRWETGETKIPDERLEQLCHLYKVSKRKVVLPERSVWGCESAVKS